MFNNRYIHFSILLALIFSSPAFAIRIADDFTQATINDTPQQIISALSWSSTAGGTLTVTTSSAHNYAVGNSIIIGGSITDSNSDAINGTYTIISVPTSTNFTVAFASVAGVTFSNIGTGTSMPAVAGNGNGLNWQPKGTACLTAGTASNNSTTVATTSVIYSSIPGCNTTGIVPSADAVGSGALRLTSGVNSTGSTSAGNQAGSIVSGTTFASNQGLQVTFTTYTYAGDSGGSGSDGADGIGFFLQDGSVGTTISNIAPVTTTGSLQNIGSFGGSLGYTCSQSKGAGLTGGYIGLGLDEYGNFLNSGDNTASGIAAQTSGSNGGNTFGSGQYQSNRIGLRGAGSISSSGLNAYNSYYYPATSSTPVTTSLIQNTCSTGQVPSSSITINSTSWSGGVLTVTTSSAHHYLAGNTVSLGSLGGSYPIATVNVPNSKTFTVAMATNPGSISGSTTLTVMDYPAIPGGYYILPNSTLIANESAYTRSAATPMTYRLILTPGGLLSFMYSYNGGAYNSVLTNFPITTANGPLPSTLRFGFAGSTGGSNNVHEISCFVAEPVQSSSSIGANTIQSGQVRTGTQVYVASYNPNGWYGSLVSDAVLNNSGSLVVSSVADWDANCVLTGGACPNTGSTANTSAESPTYSSSSRQLVTYNGSNGVSLEWGSLTAAQQAVLNSTDSAGQNRLNWLRGDRSQEQGATDSNGNPTPGPLRTRGGVLGDIVDASPLWVGPPSGYFAFPFVDSLYTSTIPAAPENVTGAQTYAAYTSSLATRQNIVYAGSNDGFMHGFRTGSNNLDGSYNSTNNDGFEVFGFMPSSVLANTNVVGLTSPTYGHSYFVDAPPGYGGLFYNGVWHTWLVSGLGAGGSEIFALDISDPTGIVSPSIKLSEPHAATVVIGDWTSATLNALPSGCVNAPMNCGNNLNNTYGTPMVKRMHNGQWAIIFGNGLPISVSNMSWASNVLTVITGSSHGFSVGNSVTISGGITTSGAGVNGSYTITTVPSPTSFTVALGSNPGTISNPSLGRVAVLTGSNGAVGNTAGIFIALISPTFSPPATSSNITFYWLDTLTGSNTNPNGIAYVSASDLDGDSVIDYLYAGDVQGNLWRFDVTSSNPADWGVSTFGHGTTPTPLFKTVSGQPITSQILVTLASTGSNKVRVILGFGTGQANLFTTTAGVTYAAGQQSAYGIWDWDMNLWNIGTVAANLNGTGKTTNNVTIPASSSQYASLPEVASTGPTVYQTSYSVCSSHPCSALLADTSTQTSTNRTMAITNVNWSTGSGNQYGWYYDFPDSIPSSSCGGTSCYEQVIYSPTFSGSEMILNTTLAASSTVAQCTPSLPTGWTMAFNIASGGGQKTNVFGDPNAATGTNPFTVANDTNSIVGSKTNSVGTPYSVSIGGSQYLINPNSAGQVGATQYQPSPGLIIKRMSWEQLR